MWLKIDGKKATALIGFFKKRTFHTYQSLLDGTLSLDEDLINKLKDEGFFWVDENIVHLIAYLNLKGFNTIASCSGHYYDEDSSCYVMFDSDKFKLNNRLIPYYIQEYARIQELNIEGKLRIGFYFNSHEARLRFLALLENHCKQQINIDYLYFPLDGTHLMTSDKGMRFKIYKVK